MFKTLLKKQLREVNAYYFINNKTGKMRSKSQVTGQIVLYAIIFLFVGISLAVTMIPIGMGVIGTEYAWIFFAVQGILAILLGAFGSVFNTYKGLYNSKDNDLLLSMPIKPMYILMSRMSSVYAMSLLYSNLIWVPTIVVYCIFAGESHTLTALQIIFQVLLAVIIPLFVTFITCILGWVVAIISSKFKSKAVTRALIAIVFLVVYYVFIGKMNEFITYLVDNAINIGAKIKVYAYPIYSLAKGATGSFAQLLIFTVIAAALLAVAIYVLSRTFIGIATTNHGSKKAEYKEKSVKANSVANALFNKELKRFTSSSTYMLNCGLGIILIPLVAVVLLIKASSLGDVIEIIGQEEPMILNIIAPLLGCVLCLILSTCLITAPSISLEGKSIWILQSLPVDAWQVLKAKVRLHVELTLIPILFAAIVFGIIFKEGALTVILTIVMATVFSTFVGVLCLALNLKRPNLSWTNEAVPVKQGLSVVIGIFGGWVVSIILGLIAYLLRNVASWGYFIIAIAVLLIPTYLGARWLKRKGTVLFSEL